MNKGSGKAQTKGARSGDDQQDRFLLVGIGASAGGVRALQDFFAQRVTVGAPPGTVWSAALSTIPAPALPAAADITSDVGRYTVTVAVLRSSRLNGAEKSCDEEPQATRICAATSAVMRRIVMVLRLPELWVGRRLI